MAVESVRMRGLELGGEWELESGVEKDLMRVAQWEEKLGARWAQMLELETVLVLGEVSGVMMAAAMAEELGSKWEEEWVVAMAAE
jgi:hypothetical protein